MSKRTLDWLAAAPGAFHTHALATVRARQLYARLEKIRGQFTLQPDVRWINWIAVNRLRMLWTRARDHVFEFSSSV